MSRSWCLIASHFDILTQILVGILPMESKISSWTVRWSDHSNFSTLTHETHKVFSHTHVKGKSTCVPNYSNHHSRGLEQTDSALTLHSLYKKEKGRLAFTHVFSSCSVETFPLKKHHYPLFVHALLQSIFFSALLNSLFSYNVVVACSSFSFSFLFPLK